MHHYIGLKMNEIHYFFAKTRGILGSSAPQRPPPKAAVPFFELFNVHFRLLIKYSIICSTLYERRWMVTSQTQERYNILYKKAETRMGAIPHPGLCFIDMLT